MESNQHLPGTSIGDKQRVGADSNRRPFGLTPDVFPPAFADIQPNQNHQNRGDKFDETRPLSYRSCGRDRTASPNLATGRSPTG